jgi:hypothetical protein
MTHPLATVDTMSIPAPLPDEPQYFEDEEQYQPSKEELATCGYLDGLRAATHRITWLQSRQSECIRKLRSLGVPWTLIAECLHITRQAAWKTYHHLDPK